MPNFNVHWMVAIQALHSAPEEIVSGYENYIILTSVYKTKLYQLLDATNGIKNTGQAKTIIRMIRDLFDSYDEKLKKKENRGDLLCFSAYTLGACGPDFWTLIDRRLGMASIHFDLGHYNRTHRQFQVAIKKWAMKPAAEKNSLQYKVERAYFLGMATHFAADLVIHQLVNVYAGAYNVQDRNWKCEQGKLFIHMWKIHNKVEHYWDSYVRYRYFGDIERVWGDEKTWAAPGTTEWMAPLEFPLYETKVQETINRLKRDLRTEPDREVRKAKEKVLETLQHENFKFTVERCFNFPRLIADAIVSEDAVEPFIYDIVVSKKPTGAYPKAIIFPDATGEASKLSDEKSKLSNFTTSRNNGIVGSDIGASNPWSYNFLTYYVCPELDRLTRYGYDSFYHLEALGPFVSKAIQIAELFIPSLVGAFASNQENNLGYLGHFWNLDTGLGISIENDYSLTSKEIITRIHFMHVFELPALGQRAPLHYERPKATEGYLQSKGSVSVTNPEAKPAFPTYRPKKPYKDIYAVSESNPDQYLERLDLNGPDEFFPYPLEPALNIKNFFNNQINPEPRQVFMTPTDKMLQGKENTVVFRENIKSRLTLQIQTAIAQIEKDEEVGFYLYGDGQKGNSDSYLFRESKVLSKIISDKTTHTFLKGDLTCLDFMTNKNSEELKEVSGRGHILDENARLVAFETQLLMNFERDKEQKRQMGPNPLWNNVVEYEKHEKHYSRNYVVATGRKKVLKAVGKGEFDPLHHFAYQTEVSPTEQIFFSLYLLVRNREKCYDLISKKEVSEEELEEIIKIDCLGFVKIVLFYVLTEKGAYQLDECYVDGLRTRVRGFLDTQMTFPAYKRVMIDSTAS